MKICSTIKITANDFYRIGDVISFMFNNGEEVRAIAVKQEPNAMLFCFENCLSKFRPMNLKQSNDGGYELSEIRRVLNSEIIDLFPAEIRDKMCHFSNGDFLRLPTEREIFGKNHYGIPEDGSILQWEPMKNLRNRIALSSSGDDIEWYWLSNAAHRSYFDFSLVDSSGLPYSDCADYLHGVRPIFSLIG